MSERNGKGRSNGHAPANLLKLTRPNGSHAIANGRNKPVLITGGAGFVGTNLAHRLLEDGRRVLLLDNLSPEEAADWVRSIEGRATIEISGGITLANARAYAATGADFISSGAITHSARAMDLSFRLQLL